MSASGSWVAVVPVKRLELAKTRLHLAGIGRDDLALAFALDTIEAIRHATSLAHVLVVTDDRRARRVLDAHMGAVDVPAPGDASAPSPAAARTPAPVHLVPDVPDAGLNTALSHGARTARTLLPGCSVVAVSADLPALKADDVDSVLDAAGTYQRAFVADISGLGTTMLMATGGAELGPEFGRRSRAMHRSSGATDLDVDARSARRDVDTAVDLWDAVRMGVGPATRALVDPA